MRVLLVEDDDILSYALSSMLRSHSIAVDACATASEASRIAQRVRFDAALVDLGLPDCDGGALIAQLARAPSKLPVICMTGRDSTESVVAAMRAGAFDYLVKPVPENQLIGVVKAAARSATRTPNVGAHVVPPLGSSTMWRDVLELASRIAAAPRAKVLIVGESGTGKDVIARYVHALSDRRDHPWIALNCACLSADLAEAELFGHEAGSFTGARTRRRGVFELADKGTLFLDEIGELALPMQAKLLRVLEEARFRRVGAEQEIDVDVRFVFATNQPLRQRAESGLFRWDLYQRLAVFEIELPPLRARPGDARHLIEGLLPGIADALGIEVPAIEPGVWPIVDSYTWPGNVRELRNFLERAVVMSRGVIGTELVRQMLGRSDVPAPAPSPLRPPSGPASDSDDPLDLAAAIRAHCERAVQWSGGNISAAARQLGISRGALRRHLQG